MIINLVIAIMTYYFLDSINRVALKHVRFFLLLYAFLILILAVTAFSLSGSTTITSIKAVWNSLTPFSKDYYDNDINNLQMENVFNIQLCALFSMIVSILLIGLFFIINKMDLNNESYLFDDDYDSGGIEENSLIIIK